MDSCSQAYNSNQTIAVYNNRFSEKYPNGRERNRQLCAVCSGETYWSFYGAIVCDPCRTFFRRQVLSDKPLVCLQNENCVITELTRKSCSFCRFQKSLRVGMKPDMVEQDVVPKNSMRSARISKCHSITKAQHPLNNTHQDSQSVVKQIQSNNLTVARYSSHPYLSQPTASENRLVQRSQRNSEVYNLFTHDDVIPGNSFNSSDGLLHSKSFHPLPQQLQAFLVSQPSPFPPALCQPNNSVTHEYLWLKKSPSSMFHYRISEMYGVPFFKYQITIEVPVADGVVCGTSCVYEDLLKNQPPADVNETYNSLFSTRFFFQNRYDNQVFVRDNPLNSSTFFDVSVTSVASDKRSVMESMTEDLWYKLTQVICASRFLQQVTYVWYYDQSSRVSSPSNFSSNSSFHSSSWSASSNEELVMKQLLLSVDMQNFTKAVSTGIELLDTFRSLPLEDQVILLKEGIFEAGSFFCAHVYSRENNSTAWSSFDNELLFLVHMNVVRVNSVTQDLNNVYSAFHDDFDDFIRQDAFVTNILCILCFFRERKGISCSEVIRKERELYFELLDKYFVAKLSSGDWQSSLDVIWNQIHHLMSQVLKVKVAYEKYAQDQMKAETKRNESPQHEYLWVRRAPNSNLEYRVLDIQCTAFVGYRVLVEVQVEDGVVLGTGCSWADVLNREEIPPELISNNVDTPFFILKTSFSHQKIFQKRHHNLLPDSFVFDVDIYSSNSQIPATMESMNSILWKTLSHVIDTAVILRDMLYSKCNISSSSSSNSKWKQLEIVGGWETFSSSVCKVAQLFECYLCLSKDEQIRMTKVSVTEVLFLQIAALFDKSRNSVVHPSVMYHLWICTDLVSMRRHVKTHSLCDLMLKVMSEFEDFLRKDEIVMAILSLLFLFKESTDNLNNTLILQERASLLELLDKYIRAKVYSKEWITSYGVICSLLKDKIAQISNIKSFIESRSLKDENSASNSPTDG